MLWQDLRYGYRMLRRNPGFTGLAVVSLAMAIGATTAIFSVVHGVLFRPLPYRDAARLAMLWTDDPKHNIREEGVSYPNFLDWRAQSRSFEDMAICSRRFSFTLFVTDESERIEGALVSANLFRLLGVAPALGRDFSADEFVRGEPVLLISHGLWRRRFGASPDAIGRSVILDGTPYRVAGVMPANFRFPDRETDVWEPLTAFPRWRRIEPNRYNDFGRVVGRLQPSVTFAQAQTEMDAIGRRLATQYRTTDSDFAGFGVNVIPLLVQVTGRSTRLALAVLFAAVVVVLLIACVNLANLLLARSAAREREIAVRAALGAGRPRLIQQLMTESALLSLASGALGLALAHAAIRALVALRPADIPRVEEIRIDGAVFIFTVAVSLLASVLFGLLPALTTSRSDLQSSLRGGIRGAISVAGSRRMRGGLVVAEFALAVILLCGAGLLIRSFLRVQAVDPGFRPDHVLTLRIALHSFREGDQIINYYQQVLERVGSLPGVQAVGLTEDMLQRRNPDLDITVEGRLSAPAIELSDDTISSGFFHAMGVRLLRGRFFTDQDRLGSLRVAIINETMARHFWPGEDPIGKRFKTGGVGSGNPWLTIVGTIADIRRQGPERQPIALYFRPFLQRPWVNMDLVVRTASEPLALAAAVRSEIRAVDKTVPVYDVSTLERWLAELGSQRRYQTLLLGIFAALALGLAAIGVYGLLHYSVSQRTQEIGIRMALGARAADVLCMVIGEGLMLAALGVAVGLLGALWVTEGLSSLLFGVTPTDPATFGVVALLLVAVAAVASLIPARRAIKVDPMVALRYE
jgi:putative ABC transport system permease protein